MFKKSRTILTPTLARAALSPHLEMERRLNLDWAPHFLEDSDRRSVAAAMEYHGADLACDAPPELLIGRRETTRWTTPTVAEW